MEGAPDCKQAPKKRVKCVKEGAGHMIEIPFLRKSYKHACISIPVHTVIISTPHR